MSMCQLAKISYQITGKRDKKHNAMISSTTYEVELTKLDTEIPYRVQVSRIVVTLEVLKEIQCQIIKILLGLVSAN